jgi:hypothetical protein
MTSSLQPKACGPARRQRAGRRGTCSVSKPGPRQHDRPLRRRAQTAPDPPNPPSATTEHTSAHLLCKKSSGSQTTEKDGGGPGNRISRLIQAMGVRSDPSTTPHVTAPSLHPSDEPLVVCQTFLLTSIGHSCPLSTPSSPTRADRSLSAADRRLTEASSARRRSGPHCPSGRSAGRALP